MMKIRRFSNYKAIMLVALVVVVFTSVGLNQANAQKKINSSKVSWHGFDRYDFVMDEQSLSVTAIQVTPTEGTGVKAPENGKRRCIVVVPEKAAKGNPWLWRGCYWDHQPQTEIEMLKRGFHIAFITPNPGEQWDAWYKYLTSEYGLSSKPAFIGMSRGGYNEYIWATSNPDKVSCIYADNPAISRESLMKLDGLVDHNVSLLNVCGSIDPLLGNHTLVIENLYRDLGGKISLMIQEGLAHHPHSLRNPKLIADFIENSFNAAKTKNPVFVGEKPRKSYYYGNQSIFDYYPSEETYIECRGPVFTETYNCYDFQIEGIRNITVIAPNKPAVGKPWVYRTDFVERNDEIALTLLAEGYYIVTGPVPTYVDGPVIEEWNTVYNYLVDNGFSNKPVLGGRGGAVGEAYAWAIANPDKVSCIYGENPVLHSNLAEIQPIDNLEPLAKAGIHIVHVCGSLDPYLDSQTRATEKKYRKLKGNIKVYIEEGKGHSVTPISKLDSVIEFITLNN